MSAILNLIEGTKQLAKEREEREAITKAELELAETLAEPQVTNELVFPEGMSDSDNYC